MQCQPKVAATTGSRWRRCWPPWRSRLEQNDPDPSRWALFALRTEGVSLLVGLGIGAVGGLVIVRSRQRGWMSDTWAQLATVALALVCFEVGERLQGSGFVTAFAGGLAYSMMMNRAGAQIPSQVTDAAGQLLELIVFAMFGELCRLRRMARCRIGAWCCSPSSR